MSKRSAKSEQAESVVAGARAVSTPDPKAERPSFNKGYGITKGPQGMRDWKEVSAQLEKAHNYWLGTAGTNGRPHVMPVWAVWMNRVIYFGTDRNSRKGQNLTTNPTVTMHLDGDDAVIVEGRARAERDQEVIAQVDKVYAKKYGMKLTGAPGDTFILAVEPEKIFAWRERDFPKSATRWRFGPKAAGIGSAKGASSE